MCVCAGVREAVCKCESLVQHQYNDRGRRVSAKVKGGGGGG